MDVPPDFEIEGRERRGCVVGHPENADIREFRQPSADKYRARDGRVVVARKDHDREIGRGEQPARPIENGWAQLVVFERIAG